MFEVKPEGSRVPIKIWLDKLDSVEDECLQQAYNLSRLSATFKHVVLLPDTHAGFGMPIGGVLAADGVIIPNAVGVDIGCGMCFIQTDIDATLFRNTKTESGNLPSAICREFFNRIPTGFNKHKKPQPCKTIDQIKEIDTCAKQLLSELDAARYQIGTLGGGNHFIEIQEDDNGKVCLMLHSGSRHFGLTVCQFFNKLAKEKQNKFDSTEAVKCGLAFLPVDSDEGRDYIWWMKLALNFARENRAKMMEVAKSILFEMTEKYMKIAPNQVGAEINCHHNYAVEETHFGKKVWVHRKGAIRAGKGEIGIIPGAMGSYSYIVEGLGNRDSFESCSHGAGRKMSRTQAKKSFSMQEMLEDLNLSGVSLITRNKGDVTDECRFAYKDIDFVMENQKDLVKPILRLKTIGVVKASE